MDLQETRKVTPRQGCFEGWQHEAGTSQTQPHQPRKCKQKEDESGNIEGDEVVCQAQTAQIIRIRFDI